MNPVSLSGAKITETGAAPSNSIETGSNVISVNTNGSVYQKRDRVELRLDNIPSDLYTLSVAVAGSNAAAAVPDAIGKWKGGLTGDTESFSDKYLPEYEGHIITGRLINEATNLPAYDEAVVPMISFTGDDLRFFTGKIDTGGNVDFIAKQVRGNNDIVATYNLPDASGQDNPYRIELESGYIANHARKDVPLLDIGSIDTKRLLEQSIGLQVQYSFSGDSINTFYAESNPAFAMEPYSSYLMEEYTSFRTMQEVIRELVKYVRFRGDDGNRQLFIANATRGYSRENTLVLLDGIPVTDHEKIFEYNPLFLKRIDVYAEKYIFGGNVFEGIVAFYTMNNNYPTFRLDDRARMTNYEGTHHVRAFFSPAYCEDKDTGTPDYRHTLYWNPDVKTDGKTSVTVPFYTSDLEGDYVITVEGLTSDGKPVYATSAITVR